MGRALLNTGDFELMISLLKLRHFKWNEFLYGTDFTRGDAANQLPYADQLINIVPTALVLDQLREEAGCPITFTSLHRDYWYNKAVGGAESSSHQDFNAADIVAHGATPSRIAEILFSLRGKPFYSPIPLPLTDSPYNLKPTGLKINTTNQGTAFIFAGGVKAYNSFTHVDTRGYNSTW